MKKTAHEPKVTDNPLYHDTWMLLRKYRDVVWSLELSVQQVRRQFQIEYGSSIEEFLESLYVAGVTFEGSSIEDHARCIERMVTNRSKSFKLSRACWSLMAVNIALLIRSLLVFISNPSLCFILSPPARIRQISMV